MPLTSLVLTTAQGSDSSRRSKLIEGPMRAVRVTRVGQGVETREDLAAGLLLAEGIVRAAGDIRHVEQVDDATVDVRLDTEAARRARAALASRRLTTTTSACGVCGRQAIDDLLAAIPLIDAPVRVQRAVIASLPAQLRAAQNIFEATGGLHAAALFTAEGILVVSAEDVGRHNAVDKVIGNRLRASALPLSNRVLFVSGRTSFEIVQKAVSAGIPIVAAVSAPSSLAIATAVSAGATLVGFVRGDSFNIYTHPERILP